MLTNTILSKLKRLSADVTHRIVVTPSVTRCRQSMARKRTVEDAARSAAARVRAAREADGADAAVNVALWGKSEAAKVAAASQSAIPEAELMEACKQVLARAAPRGNGENNNRTLMRSPSR